MATPEEMARAIEVLRELQQLQQAEVQRLSAENMELRNAAQQNAQLGGLVQQLGAAVTALTAATTQRQNGAATHSGRAEPD